MKTNEEYLQERIEELEAENSDLKEYAKKLAIKSLQVSEANFQHPYCLKAKVGGCDGNCKECIAGQVAWNCHKCMVEYAEKELNLVRQERKEEKEDAANG